MNIFMNTKKNVFFDVVADGSGQRNEMVHFIFPKILDLFLLAFQTSPQQHHSPQLILVSLELLPFLVPECFLQASIN